MAFHFENLDEAVRTHMAAELDHDIALGVVYISGRLTVSGAVEWPILLRASMETGDEASLAASLGPVGGPYLQSVEPNPATAGSVKQVPINAANVLAEGEFNRFYMRGICRRALEIGVPVEVYRARHSSRPDPLSEEKIGLRPDANVLLIDLQNHTGVATALGLPPHPNSGLCIRLGV